MKRRSFLVSLIAVAAAPFLPIQQAVAETGKTVVEVGLDTVSQYVDGFDFSHLPNLDSDVGVCLPDERYLIDGLEGWEKAVVKYLKGDTPSEEWTVIMSPESYVFYCTPRRPEEDVVFPGLAAYITTGGLPDGVD